MAGAGVLLTSAPLDVLITMNSGFSAVAIPRTAEVPIVGWSVNVLRGLDDLVLWLSVNLGSIVDPLTGRTNDSLPPYPMLLCPLP